MPTSSPNEKARLRADIRLRLPPAETRPTLSARIREHLLASPDWYAARTIGLFLPMPDEVDLAALAQIALESGRLVAVPAHDPATGAWSWRRLDSLDSVTTTLGSLGAPQPAQGETLDPACLDLILVPARAVDRQGNRLGRGKGIYDRLLAETRARRMAVVFDTQLVPEVPRESHDLPVHGWVSESGWRGVEST